MKPIATFKHIASACTESEFVGKFPHPFLVCNIPLSNEGVGAFRTAVVGDSHSSSRTGATPPPQKLTPALLSRVESRIEVVEKSTRNHYTGSIFVGRSPTNDIVIAHPSVSKSHAYFEFDPKAGWSIVAQETRNGLKVRGEGIEAKKKAPLSGEVVIIFGSYPTFFVEASTLYHLLRRMT